MFWMIMGPILAAVVVLFIIACLLGAWAERSERQADIELQQALRKAEELHQAEQQKKRLEERK
jgi:uncharacterized membrane protein